jgi:cell wall-associated NlpC family hydrolase
MLRLSRKDGGFVMIIFRGHFVVALVGAMLFSTLGRAEDDSRFTGDADSVPVKKIVHAKHKTPAKKKASVLPAPPASTNEVVNPAPVTNQVADSSPGGETNAAPVSSPATTPAVSDDRVGTLTVSDLREFEKDSPHVQRLLGRALALTDLGLSYKYGSSDPQDGGMDCSGTVYYLLAQAGVKGVPRDASEMYKWVWTLGDFRSVVSFHPDTFELDRLKPGDLLFWSGTYHVDRDPPITHVMIYLGINRKTDRRVMVGASEGRRFNDKPRYGVSVFDFTMPGPGKSAGAPSDAASGLQARFVGYGSIPGLEEAQERTGEK